MQISFVNHHLKLIKASHCSWDKTNILNKAMLTLAPVLCSGYLMPLSVSLALQPSLLSFIPVMLLPPSFRSFVYTVLSSRLLSPHFYFLYFYISFRFQLKHHFHGEKNLLTISPSTPLHATLDWVKVPYTFLELPMCFLLRTHQSQETYDYVCFWLIWLISNPSSISPWAPLGLRTWVLLPNQCVLCV